MCVRPGRRSPRRALVSGLTPKPSIYSKPTRLGSGRAHTCMAPRRLELWMDSKESAAKARLRGPVQAFFPGAAVPGDLRRPFHIDGGLGAPMPAKGGCNSAMALDIKALMGKLSE